MALQFLEQLTEMLGESGKWGSGAEYSKLPLPLSEQGSQYHHASVLGEKRAGSNRLTLQDQTGQTFKGEQLQACVTGKCILLQELTFQLVGRLLRGEKEQRQTVLCIPQSFSGLGQTAVGFAAAGRAEKDMSMQTSAP